MPHTEILDDQLASFDNTFLIADESPTVLEDLLGTGVEETDAVEIAEARGASDQGLGLLDGGIAGEVDGSWELLDGLFGHPVGELEGKGSRHFGAAVRLCLSRFELQCYNTACASSQGRKGGGVEA